LAKEKARLEDESNCAFSYSGKDTLLLRIDDCRIVQRDGKFFIVSSHPQRFVVLSRKRMKEEISNIVERVIAKDESARGT